MGDSDCDFAEEIEVSTTINAIDGISGPLEELAREFPREYHKGLMDLGARFKNRMQTEIKSGSPAGATFAPLSPLTVALRHRSFERRSERAGTLNTRKGRLLTKRTARAFARVALLANMSGRTMEEVESNLQGFGGRFPDMARYMVVNSDGVRVGFLDEQIAGSAKQLSRWQTANTHDFDKTQIHKFHQLFGKDIPGGKTYTKPERQAVEPFQTDASQEAYDSITKSIRALLKNAARRGRSLS